MIPEHPEAREILMKLLEKSVPGASAVVVFLNVLLL